MPAYGDMGKRCRVGPDDEWIDPFQDPRPDIRK
jgi:hypothetical protein